MQICLEKLKLDPSTKQKLEKLLSEPQNGRSDLEQMWFLMDKVWDEYGCNNQNLDWDKIDKFYSDPVWLLNGLFIEQHDISMEHRHAISNWIIKQKFKTVADYGGGFGTLARLIANKDNRIIVYGYEPHPNELGIRRATEHKNIEIVKNLNDNYECIVCIDVLEHVPDPLADFAHMVKSVKAGGFLITANCFSPVIKCHLPQTFHLKYTFNLFSRIMGLQVVGKLEGSHATIYRKSNYKKIYWIVIRPTEKISKFLYPAIEMLIPLLRPIKRAILK
jgi:2-polyprenyl-3-methyl-5-hydroxy-6-metoxy-1,4-benzoquinol methylase